MERSTIIYKPTFKMQLTLFKPVKSLEQRRKRKKIQIQKRAIDNLLNSRAANIAEEHF